MNTLNDKLLIERRVSSLLEQAHRHFHRAFKQPDIQLDLRGEAAGQAWPTRNLIRLNPVLLRENRSHFIHQTVAHEVAHLIAPAVYGDTIRPHGKEWKYVMKQVFNLPAERCHSYDIRHTTRRNYIYECSCPGREIPLTSIRHNRIKRGTVYLCQSCGQAVKYKEAT